jgi:hypothetical protein
MFDSQVLDVVVGLVFIYLLLSIICTAAKEMIAALFSLRARNLAKGIANLLADKRIKGLDQLLYDHPLIRGLSRGPKKPSYIPSKTFALAFLDGIAPFTADGTAVMAEIEAAVNGLPGDSELRRVLLVLLHQAGDDFAKLRDGIETWFNDSMARISGWYKRKSQLIILILAILITGLTNADTFQIVKHLSTDPELRATIATQAQNWVDQHPEIAAGQPGGNLEPGNIPAAVGAEGGTPAPGQKEIMTDSFNELQHLGIPLGWQTLPKKEEWVAKVIGLLLTILAVSLGAPFWFDILNRISKIRGTGAAPESAKEDKKGETP